MKKIMLFLMGLVMSLGLTSCVTSVQASDDLYDGEVDATIVITYGTPVLVDNMIAYYVYNGWYYYPYWIGDSYYFHRYRRALPYDSFRDWYRPIPPGHRPMPRTHRPHHPHNRYTPHTSPNRRPYIPPRHNPNGRMNNRPQHHNNVGNRPSGGNTHRPQVNHGGRPHGGHSSSTRMGGRR